VTRQIKSVWSRLIKSVSQSGDGNKNTTTRPLFGIFQELAHQKNVHIVTVTFKVIDCQVPVGFI